MLLQSGFLVLNVLCAIPAAQSQIQKLNDPLPEATIGQVLGVSTSPLLGQRVLYLADLESPDDFDLYVTRADGTQAPSRLNDPAAGDVTLAAFSPSGSRVVFLSEQSQAGKQELFSVPTTRSSSPVQLNGPLVAGGDVQSFTLTPDSSWVLYTADEETDVTVELFRAPIDGSQASVRLTSLPFGRRVHSVAVSADSLHAVYVSNTAGPGLYELYSVRVDGSLPPVRLNATLAPGGDVQSFLVTPDGARVVYLADQELDEQYELFTVPIAGGTPLRLNGTLVAGGDVVAPYSGTVFFLAPDGARVLYTADQLVNDQIELFSVPTDASVAAVRISGTHGVRSVSFEPGGSRVVYGTFSELFVTEVDGSVMPVRLSAPLQGSESVRGWVIDGGNAVIYRTTIGVYGTSKLWKVPIDASQPAEPIFEAPGGSSAGLLATLDFGRVLCELRRYGDSGGLESSLWSVATSGNGPALRLDDPMETVDGVAIVGLGALGSRVVFVGSPDLSNTQHLFSVPVDGSEAAVRLDGHYRTTTTGDVQTELVSPDHQRIVYVADQDTEGVAEVYSVPLDRASAPVRLSLPLPPGGFVHTSGLLITPDSQRLVFRQSDGGSTDLYGALLDGSQPAVRLTPSEVSGRDVTQVEVTASGQAVFIGDQEVDGVFELFRVSYAGGEAPVRLIPPLPADQDVDSFLVTSDGLWVVYFAGQAFWREFYRVPLAGGPIQALNSGPEEYQFGFRMTPDNSRLVYLQGYYDGCPKGVCRVPELRSVPIDASQASVRLVSYENENDPWWDISAGSDQVVYQQYGQLFTRPIAGGPPPVSLAFASRAELSPDRRRAVFLISDVNIFSVPLDGSAPPVRLNGAMIPAGNVDSWVVSPDSQRVVFLADANVSQRFDLFAAPIDGSSAAVQLSSVDSHHPRISADSRRVVFWDADAGVLRSVPIDACAPPRALHAPLPGDPAFQTLQLVPGSHRALFRADLEQAGAFELFSVVAEAVATSVSPDRGPAAGGNTITIQGLGFSPTTQVWFGPRAATSVTFVDAQTLTVTVPPLVPAGAGSARPTPARTVDLRVGDCAELTTLPSAYTYR